MSMCAVPYITFTLSLCTRFAPRRLRKLDPSHWGSGVLSMRPCVLLFSHVKERTRLTWVVVSSLRPVGVSQVLVLSDWLLVFFEKKVFDVVQVNL